MRKELEVVLKALKKASEEDVTHFLVMGGYGDKGSFAGVHGSDNKLVKSMAIEVKRDPNMKNLFERVLELANNNSLRSIIEGVENKEDNEELEKVIDVSKEMAKKLGAVGVEVIKLEDGKAETVFKVGDTGEDEEHEDYENEGDQDITKSIMNLLIEKDLITVDEDGDWDYKENKKFPKCEDCKRRHIPKKELKKLVKDHFGISF